MMASGLKMTDSAITLPLVKNTIGAFQFILPGYRDVDHDSLGNIPAWKIALMAVRPQVFMMLPDRFNGIDMGRKTKLFNGVLIFIKHNSYEIYPALYDKTHLNGLLQWKVKFVNIGKTSYQLHEEVWSVVTKQLLQKSVIKFVFVHNDTRRPIPIPELLRQECIGLNTNLDEGYLTDLPIRSIKPKEGYYITRTQAFDSDTDFNEHVTQAAYYRFADDAVMEAWHAGTFSKMPWHAAEQFRLKRMQGTHLAEVNAGDVLEVHVWEDVQNPLIIHSIVHNQGGKTVFDSSFEFYDSMGMKARY